MQDYYMKIPIVIVLLLINTVMASIVGFWVGTYYDNNKNSLPSFSNPETKNIKFTDQESMVINTVEQASPAVMSIIVSKDMPMGDYFEIPLDGNIAPVPQSPNDTIRREVGGGSGFLVSSDGYIITNKHVVADEDASYTVVMNDETVHDAKVVAKDDFNDVAILKIEGDNYPFIELGDSSKLKVGQDVISIGNSLGEFSNTVSTGVISGLSRNLTAGSAYGESSEQLTDVIQTDAAINLGNSGGPLLNTSGQVIGINTAIAVGAENIGFSVPINSAKNVFENVKKNGRYIRPWLGVRYIILDSVVAKEKNIAANYGALLIKGEMDMASPAVIPGSPAEKAGLKEGDVIMEINSVKVDKNNSLSKLVNSYNVGDEVDAKVLRDNQELTIKLKFEEMPK